MTLMTRQWMYDLAEEFNDYRISLTADSFYSKFDKDFDFKSEIGGTMSFGDY